MILSFNENHSYWGQLVRISNNLRVFYYELKIHIII